METEYHHLIQTQKKKHRIELNLYGERADSAQIVDGANVAN